METGAHRVKFGPSVRGCDPVLYCLRYPVLDCTALSVTVNCVWWPRCHHALFGTGGFEAVVAGAPKSRTPLSAFTVCLGGNSIKSS